MACHCIQEEQDPQLQSLEDCKAHIPDQGTAMLGSQPDAQLNLSFVLLFQYKLHCAILFIIHVACHVCCVMNVYVTFFAFFHMFQILLSCGRYWICETHMYVCMYDTK